MCDSFSLEEKADLVNASVLQVNLKKTKQNKKNATFFSLLQAIFLLVHYLPPQIQCSPNMTLCLAVTFKDISYFYSKGFLDNVALSDIVVRKTLNR